ncbi:hypothetical protein HDU82_003773 [Entophlyctis luteolus]|nr:hypothetical protein HDU82_003773 [Entophlyctis luteolus]
MPNVPDATRICELNEGQQCLIRLLTTDTDHPEHWDVNQLREYQVALINCEKSLDIVKIKSHYDWTARKRACELEELLPLFWKKAKFVERLLDDPALNARRLLVGKQTSFDTEFPEKFGMRTHEKVELLKDCYLWDVFPSTRSASNLQFKDLPSDEFERCCFHLFGPPPTSSLSDVEAFLATLRSAESKHRVEFYEKVLRQWWHKPGEEGVGEFSGQFKLGPGWAYCTLLEGAAQSLACAQHRSLLWQSVLEDVADIGFGLAVHVSNNLIAAAFETNHNKDLKENCIDKSHSSKRHNGNPEEKFGNKSRASNHPTGYSSGTRPDKESKTANHSNLPFDQPGYTEVVENPERRPFRFYDGSFEKSTTTPHKVQIYTALGETDYECVNECLRQISGPKVFTVVISGTHSNPNGETVINHERLAGDSFFLEDLNNLNIDAVVHLGRCQNEAGLARALSEIQVPCDTTRVNVVAGYCYSEFSAGQTASTLGTSGLDNNPVLGALQSWDPTMAPPQLALNYTPSDFDPLDF